MQSTHDDPFFDRLARDIGDALVRQTEAEQERADRGTAQEKIGEQLIRHLTSRVAGVRSQPARLQILRAELATRMPNPPTSPADVTARFVFRLGPVPSVDIEVSRTQSLLRWTWAIGSDNNRAKVGETKHVDLLEASTDLVDRIILGLTQVEVFEMRGVPDVQQDAPQVEI